MKKVLWVGDAGCPSGYARCTHEIAKTISESWDVHVLGLNYRGDPHGFPFPIYPCYPGGDSFGIGRIREIVKHVNPDVVLIQNDPWNIPLYMKRLEGQTVVAAVAVDGLNIQGQNLNGLTSTIFWTEFGLQEARSGGYAGPGDVIPLGVDLGIYRPRDRAQCRQGIFGTMAETFASSFIVGVVGRNQPRKRLDLAVAYFAEWIRRYGIEDAYLFLYSSPTGDTDGYDCGQLAEYYGIKGKVLRVIPAAWEDHGEANVAEMMCAFDVGLSTTQGEGWGLPAMEMMACGIPQIVPAWSAFREWTAGGALQVPCTSTSVTFGGPNVIGGVPDREATIDALQLMYSSRSERKRYADAGRELVRHEKFQWSNIGKRYVEVLDRVMVEKSTVLNA